MKHSTAYNHLKRFESIVNSIHSAALIYCPTHAEILDQVKTKVYSDPAWPKCPSWVKQSVSDLGLAWLERIHRERLVWLFELPDGSACSWDFLPESIRQEYCQPGKSGAHYWLRESTLSVGSIANPGNYKTGETISRTYTVTDKKF